MAVSLDLLTRVRNIRWAGGAVFVFGGFANGASGESVGDGSIYYMKVTGSGTNPQLRTIAMPRGFEPIGSSYRLVVQGQLRTPTFLMCGNEGEIHGGEPPFRFVRFHSMIYSSSDGIEWIKVREQSGEGTPTSPVRTETQPMSLVWKNEARMFFYDQMLSQTGTATAARDEVFGSPDGVVWSETSSTLISGPEYKSSFPATYCVDNNCFDALEQHVPDGIMRQTENVTMQPVLPPITSYATGGHSFNAAFDGMTYGSNQVQIRVRQPDGAITQSTVTINGIERVMCVGGDGNVWMAGGFATGAFDDGGAVALTTDRGSTWRIVANLPQPVLTLSAAPATEMRKT